MSEESMSSELKDRILLWLLFVAVMLLALVTIYRLIVVLPHDGRFDVVSSVWTALAADFASGTLYRPLYGEHGYGGTQYFPLHFVLHGTLIRIIGGGVVNSGYIIAVGSAIALVIGVYNLLRRLGTATALAVPCALLVLSTTPAQLAVTTVRSDLLAAALNIWGLVLAAALFERNTTYSKPKLLAAGLLFTLAFMAKQKTVFGFVAAFIGLRCTNRKASWLLAAATASGIAVSLLTAQVASGGNFLESMRSCSGGGMGLMYALHAPSNLIFWYVKADPIGLLLVVLAFSALLSSPFSCWRSLPCLILVATGLGTLFLFTAVSFYNHLLDLDVAAVVGIATLLSRGKANVTLRAAFLMVVALISSVYILTVYRDGDGRSTREERFRVVREAASVNSTILSEDPLLPILANSRPYVLDPWMFRVVSHKQPSFATHLWAMLEQQEFGVVIMQTDPATPSGKAMLDKLYFGRGFVDRLLLHYEQVSRDGGYIIYRPKASALVPATVRESW